jgi:hypothetical protein
MARPSDTPPVVRPRRVALPDEGGGVPEAPGTVPTGPSGTPIVTVGGGIEGPPAPPTPAPVSPVVPVPPAPAPAPPVPEPAPGPQPGEAGFIGPLDWWLALPIETRDELERLITTLQASTGALETQLAAERNARQALEDRLASLSAPGEPRLDALLANPPWATPDQIPPIPPIPPDFRNTGDFAGLQGRDRTFERDIAQLRTALDNVALATGNTQADLRGLRGIITSISANPNLVPVPPSAQEVSNAIAAYLSVESNRAALRGPQGPAGKDGRDAPTLPAPSVETLRTLVGEAVAGMELPTGPRGPIGPAGPKGDPGPAGEPPSPDALARIIQDVLGPDLDALSRLPDAVWEAVLGGSRERLSRLWLATLEAL